MNNAHKEWGTARVCRLALKRTTRRRPFFFTKHSEACDATQIPLLLSSWGPDAGMTCISPYLSTIQDACVTFTGLCNVQYLLRPEILCQRICFFVGVNCRMAASSFPVLNMIDAAAQLGRKLHHPALGCGLKGHIPTILSCCGPILLIPDIGRNLARLLQTSHGGMQDQAILLLL